MNDDTYTSQNEYLGITEAAEYLRVSASTLRRWEKKGFLVPERTPTGIRRYTKRQLDMVMQTPYGETPTAPIMSHESPSPKPIQEELNEIVEEVKEPEVAKSQEEVQMPEEPKELPAPEPVIELPAPVEELPILAPPPEKLELPPWLKGDNFVQKEITPPPTNHMEEMITEAKDEDELRQHDEFYTPEFDTQAAKVRDRMARETSEERPRRVIKPILIVGIIVACILLIAFVIYLLMQNSGPTVPLNPVLD
jgi:hypothetical protein